MCVTFTLKQPIVRVEVDLHRSVKFTNLTEDLYFLIANKNNQTVGFSLQVNYYL